MNSKYLRMATNFKQSAFLSLILIVASLHIPQISHACSRVLWNAQAEQVIVGRSMDWQI